MKKKRLAVAAAITAFVMLCGCSNTDSSGDTAYVTTSETTTQITTTQTETSITSIAENTAAETTSQTTTQSTTTTTTTTTAAATTTAAPSTQTTTAPVVTTPKPQTTAPPKTTTTTTSATTPKPQNDLSQKTVEEILQGMTIEEKVGQLFVVRPEKLGGSALQCDSGDKNGISKYHVGGVCMFGQNIQSPSQIKSFINGLQSAGEIPLFIAVDEEGGRVARIANCAGFAVKKFASMLSVGNTGDTSQAYNVGETIGEYLKTYGFNVDLAPVADVNTNPQNVVIGDRAFGSDPTKVAQMVASAVKGFHSKGMICCLKHFPGHGDTTEDTHKQSVTVYKTWEKLKGCEMLPFAGGINAGADMVMTAHINVPNVTSDGLPASLSYELVTGKLRGEMGFDGVVITDSLEMEALRKQYGDAKSSVLAVKAGADILLMPEDIGVAYNAVLSAVKSGEITQERLDESVRRILNLKRKYGII